MDVERRTKIIATLGPASQTPDVVRRMIAAGVDAVRLNFSHGTADEHLRRLEVARRAAQEAGKVVAVLQDLPGPKLRVGSLPGGSMTLVAGRDIAIDTGSVTTSDGAIPVPYPRLAAEVRPGDRIFLQDGELALVVRRAGSSPGHPARIACIVESGGVLRQHAGVNVPGVRLGVSAVTGDDLRHIGWGARHGVDFVGVSFVAGADDIERARREITACGGSARIVAKIERRLALDRLDEIIAAADGIMVARGDLAVETSIEDVPIVQKEIIAQCNRVGKPVITATQMVESMVSHPRPTRAEAADVANAVFDGTDVLMLSAETAIGAHPVEAVARMAAIAARAEAALPYDLLLRERRRERTAEVAEAIAFAACEAAEVIGAAAIVAATDSGSTARRVSRFRPRRPIVAVTHTEATSRQLALVWGVRPMLVEPVADLDTLVARGVRTAVDLGAAGPGDLVVVTAGFPTGLPGTTNFLKVVRVEKKEE